MAKAVKYSAIAKEIKKEYLREHLESVRKLIEGWFPTLKAPLLMPQKGIWGWESVYCPVAEQDPDNNHILRRHLRSRAFWGHHANWELKLSDIWRLANQLCEDANNQHLKQSKNMQMQYTPEYFLVALWKGFDVANGRDMDDLYKVPDDQRGVSYGAYKIELSITTKKERSLIEKEHRQFINYLAQLKEMRQIVILWHELGALQTQMYLIVNKALKSGDILYPCMFCKHLWK